MMKIATGVTERARGHLFMARPDAGPVNGQKNFPRDGFDFPPRARQGQPKLIVGKGL